MEKHIAELDQYIDDILASPARPSGNYHCLVGLVHGLLRLRGVYRGDRKAFDRVYKELEDAGCMALDSRVSWGNPPETNCGIVIGMRALVSEFRAVTDNTPRRDMDDILTEIAAGFSMKLDEYRELSDFVRKDHYAHYSDYDREHFGAEVIARANKVMQQRCARFMPGVPPKVYGDEETYKRTRTQVINEVMFSDPNWVFQNAHETLDGLIASGAAEESDRADEAETELERERTAHRETQEKLDRLSEEHSP